MAGRIWARLGVFALNKDVDAFCSLDFINPELLVGPIVLDVA